LSGSVWQQFIKEDPAGGWKPKLTWRLNKVSSTT